MEERRGACFAGSSPPFLGRERAAIDVERDVGLYSEYRDATQGGVFNRSDRNFKATRISRKSKEREKRRESCSHLGRRQRPMTGRRCSSRPRARAADDMSAEGSGLRAHQTQGGPHAPEIPTPTPAVNLRFNIEGLTKGHVVVGGL